MRSLYSTAESARFIETALEKLQTQETMLVQSTLEAYAAARELHKRSVLVSLVVQEGFQLVLETRDPTLAPWQLRVLLQSTFLTKEAGTIEGEAVYDFIRTTIPGLSFSGTNGVCSLIIGDLRVFIFFRLRCWFYVSQLRQGIHSLSETYVKPWVSPTKGQWLSQLWAAGPCQ